MDNQEIKKEAYRGILQVILMKMYILGISCYYHDAAACLIKDGKLIAAAEEERFTRKKHDTSFPINAINYCNYCYNRFSCLF